MPKAFEMCRVIGNAYRYQICEQLLAGEKNVSQLNKVVKVSQPALSQHLNKLKRGGILGCRRDQRQIFYFITNPHVTRMMGVAADMAGPADVHETALKQIA